MLFALEFVDRLRANDKTLTQLDLSYIGIGDDDDDDGTKAVAEALKQNDTLQELSLNGNNIRDEGAEAIADALKHNITLQGLNLSDNKIGDEGAQAIFNALKQNSTLQRLDFYNNNIGDEGAKAIAELLLQNNTLHVLHLLDNSIGDDGFQTIADALARNTVITGYSPATDSTKLITQRNGRLRQLLPQQAYNLTLALWPLIGGDVHTLLLLLEKFPHVCLVPQHRKVELLQQAVDFVATKARE